MCREIIAAMVFKKPAQDVVQQFAGVDRLQIERGFAARLKPQDAVAEKPEGAISIGAQTAGAVDMLRAEVLLQHPSQVRIRDLAIIRSEPFAMPRLLNANP